MNKNAASESFVIPTNRNEDLRQKLDARKLMQQACDESGLSDFGDEGFALPLGKQLDCFARDANFHAAGLKDFQEEVVRDLINRLRFQQDLKRHPEILDEDVSDPIIILGLPRSGTTKMQRMLGTDTNLLKTYAWQTRYPAPFPDAVPGQPDPRILASALGDSIYAQKNTEVRAAHYMAAEQVDEDWKVFTYEFNDWYQFVRNPSRSWHDWIISRKEPPDIGNYLYARSIFQYLQWQQGGRGNRRWLMKSCGHLAHMEELITVFPKATLVHVHRHPGTCLPSFAKLTFDIGALRVADADPKFIGEKILDWEKTSISRYLATRDRLGLDSRIFDVPYDQIRSDPMPIFREIYRRAGHTLTAEAERGMLQWEKENEQGKHGQHIYSLEQFGLSEQKIDDAFGEYLRRFINIERPLTGNS